jgi:hypothetical protein
VTVTDTGAHSRGFKGAHTHTRGNHGPSEISTPPGRGCPFHQGTTASCSSSSRQPGDTARLTLPPPNSGHTQTAGQGRCHRRRPTKRATAAPASQRTRTHQENARRWGYQVTMLTINIIIINNIKATTDSATSRDDRLTSRRQQTRRRGATYPASFNSTGHPNRRVTDGGTAKNSTPEGQACGSGRTETRSLHCDLLLDPLVAFSVLCLALV